MMFIVCKYFLLWWLHQQHLPDTMHVIELDKVLSPILRMCAGPHQGRRTDEGGRPEPCHRTQPPTSHHVSVPPQRLPRVGPGRRGHLLSPGRERPVQPVAALCNALHPLLPHTQHQQQSRHPPQQPFSLQRLAQGGLRKTEPLTVSTVGGNHSWLMTTHCQHLDTSTVIFTGYTVQYMTHSLASGIRIAVPLSYAINSHVLSNCNPL